MNRYSTTIVLVNSARYPAETVVLDRHRNLVAFRCTALPHHRPSPQTHSTIVDSRATKTSTARYSPMYPAHCVLYWTAVIELFKWMHVHIYTLLNGWSGSNFLEMISCVCVWCVCVDRNWSSILAFTRIVYAETDLIQTDRIRVKWVSEWSLLLFGL